MIRITARSCVCVSVAALGCLGARAIGQCDPLWLPQTEPELQGNIVDLCSHNGAVYAAGTFGEDLWPPASVQRWDGLNWELLPTGPNGIDGPTSWTYCLLEWQGMVLVGCRYPIGIGEESSGVAAYDGVNWRPLGHAPEHIVALAPAEGGAVLALSLDETPTVYRYDGTEWMLVGAGPPEIFDEWHACLAEYQGKVIVGAAGPNPDQRPTLFVLENGISVPLAQMRCLSGWNGVTSMTVYDGRLVVAGDFWRVDSVDANSIASWDGQTWRPFGAGIRVEHYDYVLDIEDVRVIDGALFIATFGATDTGYVDPVARWTGAEWVGHGYPQPYVWAWAVASQGTEVLVGGYRFDGDTYANFGRCARTGAPWIAWQPDDQVVSPWMSATFVGVAAAGYTASYQWHKDGVALSDGSTAHGSVISGSHDAMLLLLGCRGPDEGRYWCVVSNECGAAESRHAVLTVCVADVNSDGFVNSDDFSLFASWFEDALAYADFNADGFVNGDDYDEFAEHFEAGC